MNCQKTGKFLVLCSFISRLCVVTILFLFAFWTDFHNFKLSYNNARLVGLDAGKSMQWFYQMSESFFSWFGEPELIARGFGGMIWSIRLFDFQFTDPIAFFSFFLKTHQFEMGLFLGLTIPIAMVLLFGRVFCSFICPASILFYVISRMRRLSEKFLYFPNWQSNRYMAWGILAGGLITAMIAGHGIWSLLLPYVAFGQVIFQGIAFGALSLSLWALLFFCLADVLFGYQFTCRNICPTGRLLGWLGSLSFITITRNKNQCLKECTSCSLICPYQVDPKKDQTRDCALCGECLTICPGNCLSIERRWK